MKKSNKKLLIFAEVFFPPAYLPRIRYFCSYFLEKGWEIDLVTEKSGNEEYIPKGVSVFAIDYYKNKENFFSKSEWSVKFLINLLWDHKGRYFLKKSQAFLKEKKYDIVFCSSSFTFPLTTASAVADKMSTSLFVDLRDIAEQSPDDNHYIANKPPKIFGDLIINLYKYVNIKRRNKVLRKATGVTSVSPWHVETLSKYNKNTHLLYNGFDETKFIPEYIKSEYFTISYFGRVYNDQIRNPRLLFEAIESLNKKGLISSQNTKVRWFLDENSKKVIQHVANDYSIDGFNEYLDFIKPEDLVNEMNRSSVLLTLSNVSHKKRYFGIMTTKFFEAIGVNRPILCMPDNNDNLSALIKEYNCGLISSDSAEIENYLLHNFLVWKENGQTNGTINENIRMNFSRKKGAEILEKTIFKCSKKIKK